MPITIIFHVVNVNIFYRHVLIHAYQNGSSPGSGATVPPTAGVNETTVREIVAEMNGTVSGADVARIVSDSLAALTTSSSSTVTRNGLLAMRAALDNLIAGT